MLRLHAPLLTNLDEWIACHDDAPSRPEAIRRLVEQALAGKGTMRPANKEAARKAAKSQLRKD